MKAIMLMFDSLNRHMLSSYGSNEFSTPNFKRLSERALTFDHFYVGSMPCMPARRELHTGRLNFLHRSWGPIEPWDDSMPEILKTNGVYSHLTTDHYHYFEDGGCNYHTRYSSWDYYRGQEGDPWKGEVADPDYGDRIGRKCYLVRPDYINRKYIKTTKDFPQDRCVSSGLEFMDVNQGEDNWFLQIECFDPHEPFYAPPEFRAMYDAGYDGPHFDWPDYAAVTETPEQVAQCRREYAALMSFCDASLGRVLDKMDELDMWKDTLLIVNTDHGFLLGEHDNWAKVHVPYYEEIAHAPFFIWDPRHPAPGERRNALATTIDIPATILDFFGLDLPRDMQGKPLTPIILRDEAIHEAVLFGMHGAHVNVTDGRYCYMRGPATEENLPKFNYTLMPTRMERRYQLDELAAMDKELAEPFAFTKGLRTLKIPCPSRYEPQKGQVINPFALVGTALFDMDKDPGQLLALNDRVQEERMIKLMVKLMKENDSPSEQYARLGLEAYV